MIFRLRVRHFAAANAAATTQGQPPAEAAATSQ